MSVFADTSGLLAVLEASDCNHRAAKAVWDRLLAGEEEVVSTNYVVVETIALAQRRLGLGAVRSFQADVCPAIIVFWVRQQEHDGGVNTVLTVGRRQLSLVDCVSFEVMRSLGIRRVFCFDPHFEEQGFEVLG